MNIVYDWGISILVLLYMYALRHAVLGDIYVDNACILRCASFCLLSSTQIDHAEIMVCVLESMRVFTRGPLGFTLFLCIRSGGPYASARL